MPIADAKLEEAILWKPDLRGRQTVRDLRSSRNVEFAIRSDRRHEACERLLANVRELLATPSIGALVGNGEEADEQITA